MKKRKVCIVTGTRAEYGLLRWLMLDIQKNQSLELQIIATGMHCSPEFGLTYSEIEKDGFNINKKIEMIISSDTPQSISKSTGLGLIGFADAYLDLQPDIVVVLGDRYELLAASTAALFARIPLAHIHGGETTEGAFDEAIRHSITKMAWWHFVAADDYKKRVIQLGEDPNRVFMVGGMGVDGIKRISLLKKNELEKSIGFNFGEKTVLVTYHPVTLENNSTEIQVQELFNSLYKLVDTKIIFTRPNSDTNGRIINKYIDEFVINNPQRSIVYTSMGQSNYLSTLQFVDAVVGNSSSGLLEAPTFKIGTVNIGDRQKGRLKADSVIDCSAKKESISKAFKKVYSSAFQKKLKSVKNPYGEGFASEEIIKILINVPIPLELKKRFYNL